jgi:hypothetical protein
MICAKGCRKGESICSLGRSCRKNQKNLTADNFDGTDLHGSKKFKEQSSFESLLLARPGS